MNVQPVFEVDVAVMVQRRVRVQAASENEAGQQAAHLAVAKLKREMAFPNGDRVPEEPVILNVSIIEAVERPPGSLVLDAYRCVFCGKVSLKTEWGPGWSTCPHCGQKGTGFVGG